ncbi:MAG: mannosyl-3-phosphoglycerate synthase [Desulfobacterales bacterium]|nr:mannosyl-3-phosphoglycerate synthase [Desulfobacterales bacterium]
MRIELPKETERLGAVLIHGIQKVFELESGLETDLERPGNGLMIQRMPYEAENEIEKRMAIVIPMRNERIKLVEGVLTGIPNQCLTFIVSNSSRSPVDRFAIEKDAFERFARFTSKQIVLVHQKDPCLAEACRAAGYTAILDEKDGLIKSGKAEGMILAKLLVSLSGCRYIGFIDADNYFPGSVLEYVREYAAGFFIGKSNYIMVRISWHSKPKIIDDGLFFAKWGRTSRQTNHFLNMFIAAYTGFETDIIKTGNAGEHAMTMDLALTLDYSSGYSIEPNHFINIFERFGGLGGKSLSEEIIEKHVQIFQIESRNPHLHNVGKGEGHVEEMTCGAFQVISQSPLCPENIKKKLQQEIAVMQQEFPNSVKPVDYYPSLSGINETAFMEAIREQPYADVIQKCYKRKI